MGKVSKRNLIAVVLPLEPTNRESAREKSNRHGQPPTYGGRSLAVCRAVLFAQLVDIPFAHPVRFPDEEAQLPRSMGDHAA